MQPWLKRPDNVTQFVKVAIVQAAATNQLPHSFNGIELRTVGRQEVQTEVVGYFLAPPFVETGMVIPSVVRDNYRLPPSTACSPSQFAQKLPTGLGIKHTLRSRHQQFPVVQAHGSEKADALSGGCVMAHRVLHLWRNPHATTRTMLLEMHFIHCPQIEVGSSRQCAEFFYARLHIRGLLETC